MFKILTSSAGSSGYPEFTLATLPDATSAQWTGRHIFVTDLVSGTVLCSNGTRWRPLGGRLILASSATPASVTGTTAKTALATVALPYQIMGYNGQVIVVEHLWSMTNNANSKNPRVEVGATSFQAVAGSSILDWAATAFVRIRSSASQVAFNASNINGNGSSASAVTTGTENLAVAKDIVFSAHQAVAGDTTTLEGYTITVVFP